MEYKGSFSLLVLACCSFFYIAFGTVEVPIHHPKKSISELVQGSSPLVLTYHGGPLLTGPQSTNLYLIWYGKFTIAQKSPILDYFSSLHVTKQINNQPSVTKWWSTLQGYKDSSNISVSRHVKLSRQESDESYSLGKTLQRSTLRRLIRTALLRKTFPADPKGMYLVLSAGDVIVERFCMDSCGFHDTLRISKSSSVVFGWAGNSGIQCPGYCAWPFAYPGYGPPNPPLIPPSGDVGIDGMIIVISTILAGATTDPFENGYYGGSDYDRVEAGTACSGIYGPNAYPSYPGDLLSDKKSNASYNAYGVKGRAFLLPALWSLSTQSCKTTRS